MHTGRHQGHDEGWLTVAWRVDKQKAIFLPCRWTPSQWPKPGWAYWGPSPQRDKGQRASETLTLITFCQFNYIAWFIASASLLRPGLIIETQTKDVLSALGRHRAGSCCHVWLVSVTGQGRTVFVFLEECTCSFRNVSSIFNLELYDYNFMSDQTPKPFPDGVDSLRLVREGQLSRLFSDELSRTPR